MMVVCIVVSPVQGSRRGDMTHPLADLLRCSCLSSRTFASESTCINRPYCILSRSQPPPTATTHSHQRTPSGPIIRTLQFPPTF